MSEFLVYLGFLIPFGFIPAYATSHGVGAVQANGLLSICYGGSVFGRVLAGKFGDRFGRFNILSLICFLTGMMTLLWIKMTTFPTMVAFSILFGLFSGGIMPLSSTCVAQITPDMGYLGLRIGFMMAVLSITTFISTPISTHLRKVSSGPDPIEASGKPSGFTALFLFSGITTILGGVCILFTRLKWGSKENFAF
jgi:MFS family permease